jgi:predicted permease
MDILRHDLRHAARSVARQPGFTLAVVLCLAVGIGANAIMFGVVDTLLLRAPAHVLDADRLVRPYVQWTASGVGEVLGNGFAYPDYLALRDAHGFAETAAFASGEITLGRGAEARPLKASWVTHSFFPLLGVRPALGRFFGADEDAVPAASPVVVLGHHLWRQQFGGDPGVLGSEVVLGSDRFTVIGVAPEGFTGADLELVDVWAPVAAATLRWRDLEFDTRRTSWLTVVARLAPGTPREQAAAAAGVAFFGADGAASSEYPDGRIVLAPIQDARGPAGSRDASVALWLSGVALIVLLIACANVANLLLARAIQRRREVAVRLALGAGRRRLVRQLLAESALLALLAGAAGLLIAAWGASGIQALLAPDTPALAGSLDARVIAFTALVTTLTAVLCGLAPALHAAREDHMLAVRAGTHVGTGRTPRVRLALQVGQIALSLVLLVGAGLFLRSLYNVRTVDLGMDAERVLVATVNLASAGYTPAQAAELHDRMLERARALPGISHASLATSTPYRTNTQVRISIPGRDSLPRFPMGGPYVNAVSADFFATMGTHTLRGRPFTAADGTGAPPVVVVNETMARVLWPGGEALGECFHTGAESPLCAEVVGIVKDARDLGVAVEASPQFYVPLAQAAGFGPGALFLRTEREPGTVVETVRQALHSLVPDLPYVDVRPMQAMIEPQLRPWRLGATMFAVFGGIAMLLALVGLYGVLAFHVAQRTREIGVRMALGAGTGAVVGVFLRRGLAIGVLGIGIGSVIALAGARALEAHLFGVSGTDPLTFAAVIALLLVAATAASYIPVRRATRLDPTTVLRHDG